MKATLFYTSCFFFLTLMSGNAQGVELLWQGNEGEIPLSTLIGETPAELSGNVRDINYDGINDVVFITAGADPMFLVKNGANGEQIAVFSPPDLKGWEEGVAALFVQLDPSTPMKEVVAGIPSNNSLSLGEVQLGFHQTNSFQTISNVLKLVQVNDFNKDGEAELLFINVPDQRIEIWGVK